MGLARHFMGDYRQAVALFRENITVLTGDLVRERFGRAVAAGILSHSWLARGLAELGEFAAAIRIAEEVLQVAESTESPFAVAQACLSVGIARVARGAAAEAIAPLERGLTLCELRELYGLAPVTASYLAYAYALSGRLDDSLRLLERKPEPARVAGGQPRRLILLGEIRLLAGGNAESSRLAQQALVESREGRQHGDEGRALRLLGEIAARRDPPDALVAEAHYRQALAIAEEREMRPCVAHCHFGLGKLSRRMGKPQQAREQLDTAIAM